MACSPLTSAFYFETDEEVAANWNFFTEDRAKVKPMLEEDLSQDL